MHEIHETHEIRRRARASRVSGFRIAFVYFVCFVVFVPFVVGPTAQGPMFRGGIETVHVTVTVTDENGRLITGLTKNDFEVFEDGQRVPVTQFTDKRVPVSLGLLLDVSDSMLGQPIEDARGALDRFVGDLLEAGDEAFVASFNHAPRIVAMWTQPPSALRGRLDEVKPTGGTAIYDALVAAAPFFNKRQHTRAALIVISDGADTASDYTLIQARDAVRRTDPFIYAVAIDSGDKRRVSTRVNPDALREITIPSGGYTEVIHSSADLAPATERIANELNHQYSLGYTPHKSPDGKWRSIRVRVKNDRPGLEAGPYFARARRGYFAVPRMPRS
jgi:Ca-activated chloride channel family protein